MGAAAPGPPRHLLLQWTPAGSEILRRQLFDGPGAQQAALAAVTAAADRGDLADAQLVDRVTGEELYRYPPTPIPAPADTTEKEGATP